MLSCSLCVHMCVYVAIIFNFTFELSVRKGRSRVYPTEHEVELRCYKKEGEINDTSLALISITIGEAQIPLVHI